MIRYARFPLLLPLLGTVAIAASAVAQTTPTEAALFDEYLASLGRAYADEIATRTVRPPS